MCDIIVKGLRYTFPDFFKLKDLSYAKLLLSTAIINKQTFNHQNFSFIYFQG